MKAPNMDGKGKRGRDCIKRHVKGENYRAK